ncbi:hypothetical protein [Micromonospora sp. NPDC051006]|uniref:hypothetical protein n=1 Tax=Micromonospora sp. NPDC051006 TaxID=3364283 RepID=UPI003795C6E6
MALKLGELVAYLKTDNSQLDKGLDKAEKDFKDTGRELERQAVTAGEAMGSGIWRGADGKLRDGRGRFVKAVGEAGDSSALGFLDKFRGGMAGLPGIVSGGFSGLPPQVQGVVVAAAAAVGAVFAAGLAAAVLLGLGGGVLAAGIMLAVKDPAVAAAWKQFGDRAKASLTGFTDAFKGPVSRAAKTFGDAMERMEPSFTRIGNSMAPIIDKLAPAFTSLAEKAMPGIEKALKESKPLFDKLAEHLPKIGDSLNSFFDSIADSGPGAVIFLDLILSTFEGLIRFWGNGIEFWSNTLEVLNTFFTEKVPAAWNWLVDKLKAGVDKIGGFFTGVKDWIVKKWDQVVGFVGGLPKRIGKAASGMWDGIKNSFKSAVNWIVRKWNDLSFRLPAVSVPGLGQVFGGMTLNTPNIPQLADGGIVRATPGGRLVNVGEGGEDEAVVPLSKLGGGAGGTLRVILQWPDGRVIRDQLVDAASLRGQNVGRYLNVSTS